MCINLHITAMERENMRRRDLVKHLGVAIIVGVAGRSALAEEVCADPKTLDSGAAALRTSMNYAETSPDPAKTCSLCAFFVGGAGSCGQCQILSGPANGKGHCDSWGPKS